MVFLDRERRAETNHRLSNIVNKNVLHHPSTPGILRTPVLGSILTMSQSSKSSLGFKPDDLPTATSKWQAREISNVNLLIILHPRPVVN
jgi:hypothetical protein